MGRPHMTMARRRVNIAFAMATVLAGWSACGGGGGATAPSNDSAGFLALSVDGNATVSVPARDGVAVGQVTVAPAAAAPDSTGLVANSSYDFGPANTSFTAPVTVTIKYNPASLPAGAEASRLELFTVSSGTWTPVPGSTVDVAAHSVSAPVSHFSTFGILAPNPFAGTYDGRYSGTAGGTFRATILTNGTILVSGIDSIAGGFTGGGSLTLSGAATMTAQGAGGASNGATFTFVGTFRNPGPSATALGTWNGQLMSLVNGGGSWSIP